MLIPIKCRLILRIFWFFRPAWSGDILTVFIPCRCETVEMMISDSLPVTHPPDQFVDLSPAFHSHPPKPFCSFLPAPTPPHLEYSNSPPTSCWYSSPPPPTVLHDVQPAPTVGGCRAPRLALFGVASLVFTSPLFTGVTDPGIWVQLRVFPPTLRFNTSLRPNVLEWVRLRWRPSACRSTDRPNAKTRRSGRIFGHLRVCWRKKQPTLACLPLPLDDMAS